MQLVPLKPHESSLLTNDERLKLTNDERLSFEGAPTLNRISGPPGLVRLIQKTERDPTGEKGKTGTFWFDESVFSRLRDQAKRDLAQQNPASKQPFSVPMREMVGMYMKFCLRNDLAICKNWTKNFDAYAVLPLRPIDSVLAWVGRIKNQPYYSKPDPHRFTKAEYAAEMKIYEQAKAGGVRLMATELQYVIRFDFAANQPYAKRVIGPNPL